MSIVRPAADQRRRLGLDAVPLRGVATAPDVRPMRPYDCVAEIVRHLREEGDVIAPEDLARNSP
ncbi:hypothetical protein [Actinacidiphila sp. bgisy167]|uniref:hypothetical protein n=1 Tax=Actinacidiphila sp. bgisy167 TaxID=3413797 RepID=UPI003D7615C7